MICVNPSKPGYNRNMRTQRVVMSHYDMTHTDADWAWVANGDEVVVDVQYTNERDDDMKHHEFMVLVTVAPSWEAAYTHWAAQHGVTVEWAEAV